MAIQKELRTKDRPEVRTEEERRVVVTDVDIPFTTMLRVSMLWAAASIPAVILITAVVLATLAIFSP